ncbi:MAG: hypothetical protein EZS26_000242 [Candidatus Ordinivivax streblomastigis]|uniref:Uncharacterized protein n=1 Tax=Candidatus Ordinivivax streblomastigis TaxID=2540710 RepID=A0A5M8P5J0_9BACT|nr:MAG: hypothetical protein EZS26_000242 [Candidatus Ordinivivax streblomastigis]
MKGLAAHILANIEEVENEIKKDLKYKRRLKTVADKKTVLFKVDGKIVGVYPAIVDDLLAKHPKRKADKKQAQAFKSAIIENAVKQTEAIGEL